jgi:hypothetical protein
MLAEPILIFDGRKWDLSNLCPSGSLPLSPTVSKYTRKCSRKLREASLYPSLDELNSHACDIESAAEVFRRVSLSSTSSAEAPPTRQPHSSSKKVKKERRSSHKEARTPDTSRRNSTPLPSSHKEARTPDTSRRNSTPLPSSHKEARTPDTSRRNSTPLLSLDEIESQETEVDQGSRSSKESRHKSRRSTNSRKSHSKRSDSPKEKRSVLAFTPDVIHSRPTSTVVPGAFATTSDHPSDEKAKLKSENEVATLPSTRSLQPEASSRSCMSEQYTNRQEDDEEEERYQALEVEVAPGEYMQLRGSAETLKAVESGKACIVTCLVCEANLWCVSDADLVLCPDCRIFSPLSSQQTSQPWSRRGGVGLGAKVA